MFLTRTKEGSSMDVDGPSSTFVFAEEDRCFPPELRSWRACSTHVYVRIPQIPSLVFPFRTLWKENRSPRLPDLSGSVRGNAFLRPFTSILGSRPFCWVSRTLRPRLSRVQARLSFPFSSEPVGSPPHTPKGLEEGAALFRWVESPGRAKEV